MLLSDRAIEETIAKGRIGITFPGGKPATHAPRTIQPASVDVHLSNVFRVFSDDVEEIDPRDLPDNLTSEVTVPEGWSYLLPPGAFVLGSTVESVKLSAGYAAELSGRSSMARLGILVHATAGFVDPGFSGTITFEIKNINTKPVHLWPGDRIAQLLFFRLSSDAARPYGHKGLGSRYQGQTGPTASRFTSPAPLAVTA